MSKANKLQETQFSVTRDFRGFKALSSTALRGKQGRHHDGGHAREGGREESCSPQESWETNQTERKCSGQGQHTPSDVLPPGSVRPTSC